jgi:glycosyltransferase involved in cell wall biosynthesis
MPATNAAIWFTADGFDPDGRGINGRRVAGESFLRGLFAHAEAEEFVALVPSSADEDGFAALAARAGVTRPLRAVRLHQAERIAPVEVLFYPAPLAPAECWRRAPHGPAAWALCGITHTTATQSVMQGLYDLRSAPQMPWDAVICTSQAVQQSLRSLMELAEDHLARRFPGAVLPARPLLPVVPLGVHTGDFRPDRAAGQALRRRLAAAPGDIVVATIARLTPDEKFDPLPLFLALQAAAPDLRAAGAGLHLVFCGQFRDKGMPELFAEAAARLMPSVGYHVLDGGSAEARTATLSAADIFVFPVDNVQETFGLAPVEAMAAGLPVIVSDWDGLRDSITPEVGLRIPTEVPPAGQTGYLAARYLGGTDTYVQYVSQLAALTRVDVAALARAVVTLGRDPDLRRRMGAAGQRRARDLYDWRVVIPQMQALWAEQAAMLAHARERGGPAVARLDQGRLPVGPAPDRMFAAYPSTPAPNLKSRRLRAVTLGDRPDVAQTLALRRYLALRRLIDDPARVQAALDAYAAAGPAGATLEEAASRSGIASGTVSRLTVWLLKYHFLEPAP